MWSWSVPVEVHLRLIQKIVLRDSASEVPVLVGPNSYNPGLSRAVTPLLTLFIQKVDAVAGQGGQIEGK